MGRNVMSKNHHQFNRWMNESQENKFVIVGIDYDKKWIAVTINTKGSTSRLRTGEAFTQQVKLSKRYRGHLDVFKVPFNVTKDLKLGDYVEFKQMPYEEPIIDGKPTLWNNKGAYVYADREQQAFVIHRDAIKKLQDAQTALETQGQISGASPETQEAIRKLLEGDES